MLHQFQLGQFGRSSAAPAGSGSQPDSFANLTMWIDATNAAYLLDASGGSVVTSDGQTVGLAKSRAGDTPRCLNQTTSGKRGTYRTGVVNGKSVLRFDGTDDAYDVFGLSGDTASGGATFSALVTASAGTIVAAVKVATAATAGVNPYDNSCLIGDQNGFIGLYVPNVDASNVKFIGYNWDGNADVAEQTVAKNSWWIVSFRHTGGNIQTRVNRGSWATTASGNTSNLSFQAKVGVGNSASKFAGFDLLGLATYSAALSDANLASVEDYFAAQLGISL